MNRRPAFRILHYKIVVHRGRHSMGIRLCYCLQGQYLENNEKKDNKQT